MADLCQTKASSFIYLLILCPVCTCEHTDHGALGPTGRLTLHPWPPSAGQTLTLEQMDNGLYALSAPVHTLLLPALDTAFPFTSCCPPFLFFHLPCPAFDCLNSLLSECFPISIILFPIELLLYCSLYIYIIPCLLFSHFHSLSILTHAGASFMQCD